MSAATSSRSCAIWSRSAIAHGRASASARTSRPRPSSPPRSACSTRWSAPAPARRRATRSASKLRDGELDDKEIEIELSQSAGGHADVRDARHAGRVGRHDQPRRHAVGKALRRAHQDRKRMTVAEAHELLIDEESRQAARPGAGGARGDRAWSSTTASSSSTRSTRSAPREGRGGADVSPRGRAARPAAADRGHDGRDQARPGQDRPHPVHRLGRVPRRQAVATCCPSCRAACRSASSCAR